MASEVDTQNTSSTSSQNGTQHSSSSTHHHHSSSSSRHHHSTSSSKRHRSHHEDDSDRFKRQSLRAIQRKKFIEKWLFIILEVAAALVVLALIYVYMFT